MNRMLATTMLAATAFLTASHAQSSPLFGLKDAVLLLDTMMSTDAAKSIQANITGADAELVDNGLHFFTETDLGDDLSRWSHYVMLPNDDNSELRVRQCDTIKPTNKPLSEPKWTCDNTAYKIVPGSNDPVFFKTPNETRLSKFDRENRTVTWARDGARFAWTGGVTYEEMAQANASVVSRDPTVSERAGEAWRGAQDAASEAADVAGEATSEALSATYQATAEAAAVASENAASAWAVTQEAGSDAAAAASEGASSAWEATKETSSDAVNSVAKGASDAWRAVMGGGSEQSE